MFIFSKGLPKTVNLISDRKNKWLNSWGKQSARNKAGELQGYKREDSNELGVRFNIWRINNGAGYSASDDLAYDHPAIFPEALARDHILSWSNEGDIVLDPFCGSGTTCKMAKMNSRNYIGIEISPEYVTLAERRILATNVPLFSMVGS
jgi:DNA modification methylase